MGILTNINPTLRAVGVIGAVTALVTSVTFAALGNSAALTGTTLASANASLLIWDGDGFESSAPGFTVENIVPGEGSAAQAFYLKNAGGVDLNLSASVPVAPTTLSDGLTTADIKLTITGEACTEPDNTVVTTLAALVAGPVEMPCNALAAGAEGNGSVAGTPGNYNVVFDIDPSAPNGAQATVSAFDIVFDGEQPTE